MCLHQFVDHRNGGSFREEASGLDSFRMEVERYHDPVRLRLSCHGSPYTSRRRTCPAWIASSWWFPPIPIWPSKKAPSLRIDRSYHSDVTSIDIEFQRSHYLGQARNMSCGHASLCVCLFTFDFRCLKRRTNVFPEKDAQRYFLFESRPRARFSLSIVSILS